MLLGCHKLYHKKCLEPSTSRSKDIDVSLEFPSWIVEVDDNIRELEGASKIWKELSFLPNNSSILKQLDYRWDLVAEEHRS